MSFTGNAEEASNCLDLALEVDKFSSTALVNSGNVLMMKGNLDAAKSKFADALVSSAYFSSSSTRLLILLLLLPSHCYYT